MCNISGCQVISIEYRLAPEHPFPAPVDDPVAAFRHVAANAAQFDTQADKLAVGGDSAGGNLAAVVCQVQKQSGGQMPSFQLLIYPATDMTMAHDSLDRFAEGYLLTRAAMAWFIDHYMTGSDKRNLRASPLLASSLEDLPPAYVITAGFDPVRPMGRG